MPLNQPPTAIELRYASGMAATISLSDRARDRMAVRFRALGEPTRLKILERLFRSPASVSEILAAVGSTQANVSKHLAVLRAGGLVRARKAANRTVYRIADPSLERLCAVVCDAVKKEAHEAVAEITAAGPRSRRR
ncbi:MAG TPA: metalloregulator ArsR/SmtB family transcription factor [Thermoanaerobaculia bacterium]|nr:metalloregulator ArsR/SmtB family transcription factor [Thermoanaerobaculia bacterium]